jgi:glycosyltransferase involved in cell wall biosynthesis
MQVSHLLTSQPTTISIVLPVYNGLPHLERALGSLTKQDLGGYELIIVDDGSTDGSAAFLREWVSRPHHSLSVKLIVHDSNRGLPAALNRYNNQVPPQRPYLES